MPDFDNVVIGAGVVGLAVARELSKRGSTLLIEKNKTFGEEVSSRNSEVIHSGIYYKENSKKAFHCQRGKELLYGYCKKNNIPHKKIGKLIVSEESSSKKLHDLLEQGKKNGLHDLVFLDREELLDLEPELTASKAILSPSTGIIDSHSFMQSLLTDFENEKTHTLFKTTVLGIDCKDAEYEIEIKNPDDSKFMFTAKNVVSAAGLHTSSLFDRTKGKGAIKRYSVKGVKGNYYSYSGKSPFSRLIYPLPDKYGLGIHSTLDLSGKLKFGPDVDLSDDTLDVNTDLKEKFSKAIRSYWTSFDESKLHPDYSGLRPKIVKNSEFYTDFIFQTLKKRNGTLLFLHGIESPGLTSSLSIGEYIANCLFQK